MSHAIRIHRTGGPEVLQWEEVAVGEPGPGQAKVRQTAVGLNFIDVYHRTGLYPLPLPATIGQEGAGVVEAVGAGVTGVAPGDRVAYCAQLGAYAEVVLLPAERLLPLPDAISEEQAGAMMIKGMTAHYLLRRTHRVEPGEAILVHAAAGGVGLILCQWAAALGATVIGTVSSDEKAALARESGCGHVIVHGREDLASRVRELTGGAGVAVVYDSIGKDTFEGSLDSLRRLGLLVTYGNASGPAPAFSPALLAQKGSLFLTRPVLGHYIESPREYRASAAELFDVVASGKVRITIGQRHRLAEAAQAHRDLEGRRTRGSTVLLP